MERALIVPYFYQYGAGLLIFVGALVMAHRAGALNLRVPEIRRTFTVLVGGMAVYAIVHALLQFVFPFVFPFEGPGV